MATTSHCKYGFTQAVDGFGSFISVIKEFWDIIFDLTQENILQFLICPPKANGGYQFALR